MGSKACSCLFISGGRACLISPGGVAGRQYVAGSLRPRLVLATVWPYCAVPASADVLSRSVGDCPSLPCRPRDFVALLSKRIAFSGNVSNREFGAAAFLAVLRWPCRPGRRYKFFPFSMYPRGLVGNNFRPAARLFLICHTFLAKTGIDLRFSM